MSLTRVAVAPLVLLFALIAILGDTRAQQTPPAPAATPAAPATASGLNILVVDVQSLLQNSKSAKMVREQIEQKRTEYAKEISREEGVLRQERDALQRQQASLSAEALNKKGREFQQKVNGLDKSVQAKRQALERSNGEALEKIQAVMLKIINEIAKERKANIVFQRSELVMFDQGFDVTDEVLRKLDEQMPTLTVNFVAPVASNAPEPAPEPAAPKKKKK
jgi:Skp family chaperone for outer membrane proteins